MDQAITVENLHKRYGEVQAGGSHPNGPACGHPALALLALAPYAVTLLFA